MKTLTKHKTHIAQVRQVNATQIDRVCELLDWTKMQYCQHQYNEYEKFITRLCEDLPKATNPIRYSSIFRGFWCNEWMLRTELEFMPYADGVTEDIFEVDQSGKLIIDKGIEYGDSQLAYEYYQIHNAKGLFYNEGFAVKVGYIIDQILPYV